MTPRTRHLLIGGAFLSVCAGALAALIVFLVGGA